jgi:hypothetical protein
MIETGFTVSYNGVSPWGTGVGSFPPFVSVEISEDWTSNYQGSTRTVTLNGTIPSGGFTGTIQAIKNAFSTNFGTFSAPNVSMPSAMIEEITFDSQKFIGKTDYQIRLRDYSGCLNGILEPIDEISIEETIDGAKNISHRVSARGVFSTDSSLAFANAKTFVLSRTGISTWSSYYGAGSPILISQQESINRLEGVYSIVENYKLDTIYGNTSGIFKRFVVDLNSGIGDEYVRVDVSETIQMSKTGNISILKNFVSQDELYRHASGMYLSSDLNREPVSMTIDLDETGRILTAKTSFDNSLYGSYFDFEIDTQKDYKTQITTIGIKGNIVGSGRHVRKKYEKALEFYNNTIGGFNGVASYLYTFAQSGLLNIAGSTFPLNSIPQNITVSFNSGVGVISINSSFDDAPFVSGYSQFKWSASTDCGLNIFKPFASANKNGSYLIQDFNIINRTSVNLNGTFEIPRGGTNQTKHLNILSLLKNEEGMDKGYVEQETYSDISGESIASGFAYNYTKQGCQIGTLPTNRKIYSGVII